MPPYAALFPAEQGSAGSGDFLDRLLIAHAAANAKTPGLAAPGFRGVGEA